MKRLHVAALGAALTLIAPALAVAQSAPTGHGAMDHGTMDHGTMGHGSMNHGAPAASSTTDSASTQAFKAGSERMHRDMAIEYSGKADVDFARGMIPHHQGAIDMAKVELEFGTDPELRKLAEEIIAAQEKEIAQLKAWLAKHAK